MAEAEEISVEEFEEEMEKAAATRKGKWVEVIAGVVESGCPVKVSDLSRGQLAALQRAAKEAKIRSRASWKEGWIVLGK